MKNVTWVLLILVLAGQALVSGHIAKTNRALVSAVYIIASGTTLEQLDTMYQKEIAAKNRSKDNQAQSPFLAKNYGLATPSTYAR